MTCNNIAAEETSNAEASDLISDPGLAIGGLHRDMMLELILLGDTLQVLLQPGRDTLPQDQLYGCSSEEVSEE